MNSLTTWRAPLSAALAGALVGGAAVQILIPVIRRVDPLGVTPIALLILMGTLAIAWYVRSRQPSAGAFVVEKGEL